MRKLKTYQKADFRLVCIHYERDIAVVEIQGSLTKSETGNKPTTPGGETGPDEWSASLFRNGIWDED